MQLTTGVSNLTGMLVYNTTTTLGPGIYFWSGSQWVVISGDGVVGNGLMDTIAGGGLNKTGAGTAANPYKVGIKTVLADSGLYLVSTGTSVAFAPRYLDQAINPDSIKTARPSRTVNWTIVVDTPMIIHKYANRITQVYIYGVMQGDLCYPSGYTDEMIIMPVATNILSVISLHGNDIARSNRIRCFRPSF